MNGDQMMRAHSATLPAPEFPNPAWVTPPPLADATVAIVTSAALYASGDDGFTAGDTSYRLIDRDRRDLVMGHWSPNFDHTAVAMDLNVVYPIDRLEELAAQRRDRSSRTPARLVRGEPTRRRCDDPARHWAGGGRCPAAPTASTWRSSRPFDRCARAP